jgi:hypothetical protein
MNPRDYAAQRASPRVGATVAGQPDKVAGGFITCGLSGLTVFGAAPGSYNCDGMLLRPKVMNFLSVKTPERPLL